MALFKYIGEAPNGPFKMYGAEWGVGTVAEVGEAVFIKKLCGNKFFEAVSSGSAVEPPAPEAAVAHVNAPSEIDELRARLTALGEKVDGRWSVQKLKHKIQMHGGAA